MNIAGKKKIVVLGMMTKMPVAGVVWQVVHYVMGLERLGYEGYYVEAHALMPTMFMEHEDEDPSIKAAAFIDRVMRRYDMGDRWCFHSTHDEGHPRCFGMSEQQLMDLYKSAHLIINLHGATKPRPEHYATNRLVFLETDPVQVQIELAENRQETLDYLAPHCAFFTFGENWGARDCKLPMTDRFKFHPTRQPVIMDMWEPYKKGSAECFTTVGNWNQPTRTVTFRGETYHWSKHYEFLKFLDLPKRTRQPFELALASFQEDDRRMLEKNGWRVKPAAELSREQDSYRDYIGQSRGEFTVAKDQNVRLRSGWFSDRSATYLAAGRPVITQDTGFDNILPTGQGLFGFSTMRDILKAVDRINSDYEKHSKAATQIAREYFSHDVVLPKILKEVGV